MDCRGANTAAEFDRQWRKTVAADLAALRADVVAFMEMENDGYGSDSAEQFLVGKLNEEDGAGTWAFIDADARTGQPDALGNDAIKVGMLYKPGRGDARSARRRRSTPSTSSTAATPARATVRRSPRRSGTTRPVARSSPSRTT